jgi:hypothetical protein
MTPSQVRALLYSEDATAPTFTPALTGCHQLALASEPLCFVIAHPWKKSELFEFRLESSSFEEFDLVWGVN